MPPAARGHQTLSTYISARFDEFSRSQKDVAQYVVDHLDEVAFHTAEELARRANTSSSTVVRFSQALGFEGFPELQEAAREEYRHHHRTAKTPEHGDAAVQPRPVAVRAGRRRRSRQRRGHGAARQPLRGRRRDRGDRRRRADPDRRHGPDGVLRLLSAPPADAARRARRDRRQPVAGGAVAARPDRRAHARDRAVRRPPAPAGRARDEDRPPPPRGDARDRRRDALRRLQAVRAHALLLVELARLRALATPACCRILQALAYGVYARDTAQYDDRIRAFRLK